MNYSKPMSEFDYGDYMPFEDWLSDVNYGMFIDDDGYGYLVKDDLVDPTPFYPSDTNDVRAGEGATGIIWFNK